MGTVFEELVRKFNEENNEEAGEHWTPRDAVKLMANLSAGKDFRRKANRPGPHVRSTSPHRCSFHLVWSLVAAGPRSPARQAAPTKRRAAGRQPSVAITAAFQARIIRSIHPCEPKGETIQSYGPARRADALPLAIFDTRPALVEGGIMIDGLKPYPEYKASGVAWILAIPSGWDLRRAKMLYREVDDRSTTGKEELLSVSHKTGVTPRSQKMRQCSLPNQTWATKSADPTIWSSIRFGRGWPRSV